MEIIVLGLTTVYSFLLFSSLIVLMLFMCNSDPKNSRAVFFQDRTNRRETSLLASEAKDKITEEAVSDCCYSFTETQNQ